MTTTPNVDDVEPAPFWLMAMRLQGIAAHARLLELPEPKQGGINAFEIGILLGTREHLETWAAVCGGEVRQLAEPNDDIHVADLSLVDVDFQASWVMPALTRLGRQP